MRLFIGRVDLPVVNVGDQVEIVQNEDLIESLQSLLGLPIPRFLVENNRSGFVTNINLDGSIAVLFDRE